MDGRPTKLTWGQAREMRDSGLWSIGNHTRDHRRLTEITVSEIRVQIDSAYAAILAQMGEPPIWFVAPYHASNKNVEIISSRLHARSRSLASAPDSQGSYTFPSSSIQPWDVWRYPGGLSVLPQFLNDLYYRTVVGGDIIRLYMHEITPTNVDTGATNIGEAEHRALLQGIRDRNIPVLDARALAYPRLNLLDDPSFELGGKMLSPLNYNGTAAVRAAQPDAHSGSSYLRLTTAGATGSGPRVAIHMLGAGLAQYRRPVSRRYRTVNRAERRAHLYCDTYGEWFWRPVGNHRVAEVHQNVRHDGIQRGAHLPGGTVDRRRIHQYRYRLHEPRTVLRV